MHSNCYSDIYLFTTNSHYCSKTFTPCSYVIPNEIGKIILLTCLDGLFTLAVCIIYTQIQIRHSPPGS